MARSGRPPGGGDIVEIDLGSPEKEERSLASGLPAGVGPRRVVVVGCSAGGLEAMQEFFGALPERTGAAFVVVQHTSPDFRSLLPELLEGLARIPVRMAASGDALVEDGVLVVPPGHQAEFDGSRLRLEARDPARPAGDSGGLVDRCLVSLAGVHGARGIALILSGTGGDGAIGIQAVAEAGGTVIVQSPASAEFPAMPRRAVASGRADHVLAPAKAARVLAWLAGSDEVTQRLLRDASHGAADSVFAIIIELIEADESYGLDHFDSRMLARRILQRMSTAGIPTPEAYAELLRWDAVERRRLRDAMIDGETVFLRDAESWRILGERVIRRLVAEAGVEPIRVWTVGCSSGEDAFMVALQFEEEMARADRRVPYKIFATDLLRDRVERASSRRFTVDDLKPLPADLVRRGFLRDRDQFVFAPALRRQLVFAQHDVRSDPAFTRLDLIVCHGVLSSFDETGRRAAVSRMVFGLRPRGTLFLGGDEQGIDDVAALQPLHLQAGLYTRRPDEGGRSVASGSLTPTSPLLRVRRQREMALGAAVEAVLGDNSGRMCLLVGTDGQLLHAFGDTARFLAVKPGSMKTSVHDLVIEPLRSAVEWAMARAIRTGQPASMLAVEAMLEDDDLKATPIDVRVAPVDGDGSQERQLSLVVEAKVSPASGGKGDSGGAASPPADESESSRLRAGMKELAGELTVALKQRKALASELRETARRAHENHAELMSVNEELYTVNREHEAKIRELIQLNSDMENLLRTAHVGTVFLDRDLNIRRRTPASDVLFSGAVSASADDMRMPEGVDPLAPDLRRVLREGVSIERQVRLADGRDYLIRLNPYRRTDNGRLDGVVVTVVDVTDLKRAEFQLRRLNAELVNRNQEAEAFAHTVSHDLKSPLVTIGCMMGLLRESLAGAAHVESMAFVDQTEATVQSMRQTIDDLLELSRVGRTRNRLTAVDLNAVVREWITSNEVVLDREGVEVRLGSVLPVIEGDRPRLAQLLDNLMSNALKYGCGGAYPSIIEIDAEAAERSESGESAPDAIVLSVADRGPGVPEAFREQIFGLFQRLHRDLPGTGVGLALVRRIAETHGGRVWVERRAGGGARFRVQLPRTAPPETLPLEVVPRDDVPFTG